MIKMMRFFMLLVLLAPHLHASLIYEEGNTSYYRISKGEPMPDELGKKTKEILFPAYDPKLHEGLSVKDMGIKEEFLTYEDFLSYLLDEDLKSYLNAPDGRIIFYACSGQKQDDYSNIVGFCSLLPIQDEPGHYYMDHIGTKKNQQRSGIGSGLVKLLKPQLPDMILLKLDTRVFNSVSQPFYDSRGFTRIQPHPLEQKEGRYLRYEKRFDNL